MISNGIQLLALVGVLTCVLVAAATTAFIRTQYDQAIVETGRGLESLSMMLTDEADRAFQSIELVQDSVLAELRGELPSAPASADGEEMAKFRRRSMQEALTKHIAGIPQLDSLGLFDRNGQLIVRSGSWPTPDVNVADRAYFKAFIANPGLQRSISGALINRADGSRTMFIARRIAGSDGSFLGIVVGAVDLGYFERLYAAIAPYPDYTVALFSNDGELIARYPATPELAGRRFPASAAMQLVASGASMGSLRIVSPFDGRDRVGAIRRLTRYPLVISSSRSVDAAVAAWRKQAWVLGGGAMLFELGLLGIILLGVSQLRAQASVARSDAARVEAEARARGEADLRQQYARFGTALDNMAQGLCLFDAADRLVVANRRAPEMFGLSEAPPPGTSFPECVRRVARSRLFRRADVPQARALLRQWFACRQPRQSVFELSDGRAVSVRFQPSVEMGWLLSCEDITEQRLATARMEFLAHHDPLTRLANRILFHDRLEKAAQLAKRGTRCAVLCLDLDRFKEVNDSLGHAAGDRLLEEVARRILGCVRACDTVARLGGDEFAVIQTDLHHTESTRVLAERIIEALSLNYSIAGQQVSVGVSIGAAIAPDDGEHGETLLRHADMALYWAKSAQPGSFRFFDQDMNAEVEARQALMADLCRALPEGEFELYYQPLIRVTTGRVVGFEALLRWHHPTAGLMAPGHFILQAEEAGLILPIGEWVLNAACTEAARWPGNLRVAVNLSAGQFRTRNLVATVTAALERSGLAAERLELEITETALLQDTAEICATLHLLRDLGVTIVMDDFGTGYSSLSYLHQFPFDKLKIDRSFVADLASSREALAITNAITGLCRHLNITTVAEGVESELQLDILREQNCTEVQGYLFSQPRPASGVPQVLRRFGHDQPIITEVMEAESPSPI
jgi:diguanylate cyclase (GGDEF)-like protein